MYPLSPHFCSSIPPLISEGRRNFTKNQFTFRFAHATISLRWTKTDGTDNRWETLPRSVFSSFFDYGIGGFFTAPGKQCAYAKKRTYKVTVIGNSLVRTGSQLKYLKQIGKLYNTDIKVYNQVYDGYELSDHVVNANLNKCNICKQLKKSARSYYYMTEFDNSGGELVKKLKKRGV